MVLVVVDQKVDDLGPILQRLARTNEEVFLVEDMQDLVLELFYKKWLLLQQAEDQLTCPLNRQVLLLFVLDQRQHCQNYFSCFLYQGYLTVVVEV